LINLGPRIGRFAPDGSSPDDLLMKFNAKAIVPTMAP